MPLRTLLRKLAARAGAAARTRLGRTRDRLAGSYAGHAPDGALQPLLDAAIEIPQAQQGEVLQVLARHYCAHRFDLLGSGWVRVFHGRRCLGVEGHAYPPAPMVRADRDGEWLGGQVSAPNLRRSRELWGLVDPGYEPIDWQLDFKSGYRWSARRHAGAIATAGNPPGVDIKLPWELARGQHLPQIALAFGQTGDAVLAREFRNQVLDFAAQNPPRFGVNWVCTMDVAIRIANWLLARDLFRAAGARFDAPFEAALARATYEHAVHIASHLEWHESIRGNHYLADVCGLLFAAASLPASAQADEWLAFAAREVLAEAARQFYEEGSSFEASTAYHRLSAELVVYAAALLLGRGFELPAWLPARMAAMGEFARDLARHDGRAVQFGDNDSGRLFKLPGAYEPATAAELRRRYRSLEGWDELDDAMPCPDEDVLDQRELVEMVQAAGVAGAVVSALARGRFEPQPLGRPAAGGTGTDADLTRALAELHGLPESRRQRYRFPLPASVGGALRFAYPQFGVYGWRDERWSAWVRCGAPVAGMGGHAHNDALALELEIDGAAAATDAGTYLYTPLPQARNRYRSARAHFVPRVAGREPAALDDGLFALAPTPGLGCLYFGARGFAGVHDAFGARVMRVVLVERDAVSVEDGSWGEPLERCELPSPLPVSPKYGALRR